MNPGNRIPYNRKATQRLNRFRSQEDMASVIAPSQQFLPSSLDGPSPPAARKLPSLKFECPPLFSCVS